MSYGLEELTLKKCCDTHCRTWDEMRGGKYPPSDHSPGCQNYVLKKYIRVSIDGSSFIDTQENIGRAKADIEGDLDSKPAYKEVYLTEDQFNKLREFEGF